jgi:hypothetical protein
LRVAGLDNPDENKVPRFVTFLMAEALGRSVRAADGLAAIAVARIWSGQRRAKKAPELPASVYDRFTGGFTTADLRSAKSLVGDLP